VYVNEEAKMRRAFLIIGLFLLLITAVLCKNDNNLKEIEGIANELRIAVLNQDIETLLKYVSPGGTYFIDDLYHYSEIKELLYTNDSWLYKHLFVGEKSVRHYFENAENLRIKIDILDEYKDAPMIFYQSSNYKPLNWVECCLIKHGERWYFNGIFSCE